MKPDWWKSIISQIDEFIGDRSIGRADLAEGLEEIESHAGGWAQQLRDELEKER